MPPFEYLGRRELMALTQEERDDYARRSRAQAASNREKFGAPLAKIPETPLKRLSK